MLVIALLAHISTCRQNITINILFDLVAAGGISRTQVCYITMDIFGVAATGKAGKKFSVLSFGPLMQTAWKLICKPLL